MRCTIEKPSLWIGHTTTTNIKPWDFFHVDGIILNAHDILTNKSFYSKLLKEGSLKKLTCNNGGTKVILDSGGFLFQKKRDITLNLDDVIELIKMAKPKFSFVLDHPLDPAVVMENYSRIDSTIKNTEYMLERIQDIDLVPIIHGYSKNQINYCIHKIRKLYSEDPDTIAIGSLVPLIKTTGTINKYYFKDWHIHSRRLLAFKIINEIKIHFPESKIHLFGIGGTNIMHLMFLLVDSIDSMGWRWSAAHGMIRLFNIGERYASNKYVDVKWNPKLTKQDWDLLHECKCPICSSDPKNLITSFKARAIHNAFVYQQEVDLTREMIKKGRYFEFLQARSQNNNTMNHLLKYIAQLSSFEYV